MDDEHEPITDEWFHEEFGGKVYINDGNGLVAGSIWTFGGAVRICHDFVYDPIRAGSIKTRGQLRQLVKLLRGET